MGLLTTADLRKNVSLELDGEPYAVVEVEKHAPTARGGKTLIRVKLRNLRTRQLVDRTFKAGEAFAEPDLASQQAAFSYATPEALVFLDQESFETVEVPREVLGDEAAYVTEGLLVSVRRFNGQIIAVELPQYVELVVDSVLPGARGNTAAGSVTTQATLQGGVTAQVPLYIKAGDRVRVDPRTGEFRDRVG
ncbi:MAG: elongation factor P [Deltaproteobacteria bacterium]|nr:elongation factor P [Deltaproteobacteria bacterium]